MAAAAASSGSSSNAPALSEYEKALKQNKEIEEKYPNIHLGEPASLLAVYSSNKEIIAKQSQGSAVAGTPPHRTMSGACLSLCSLSWSYVCLWSCMVGCRWSGRWSWKLGCDSTVQGFGEEGWNKSPKNGRPKLNCSE